MCSRHEDTQVLSAEMGLDQSLLQWNSNCSCSILLGMNVWNILAFKTMSVLLKSLSDGFSFVLFRVKPMK